MAILQIIGITSFYWQEQCSAKVSPLTRTPPGHLSVAAIPGKWVASDIWPREGRNSDSDIGYPLTVETDIAIVLTQPRSQPMPTREEIVERLIAHGYDRRTAEEEADRILRH